MAPWHHVGVTMEITLDKKWIIEVIRWELNPPTCSQIRNNDLRSGSWLGRLPLTINWKIAGTLARRHRWVFIGPCHLCVHRPPAEVLHLFRCYTHTNIILSSERRGETGKQGQPATTNDQKNKWTTRCNQQRHNTQAEQTKRRGGRNHAKSNPTVACRRATAQRRTSNKQTYQQRDIKAGTTRGRNKQTPEGTAGNRGRGRELKEQKGEREREGRGVVPSYASCIDQQGQRGRCTP